METIFYSFISHLDIHHPFTSFCGCKGDRHIRSEIPASVCQLMGHNLSNGLLAILCWLEQFKFKLKSVKCQVYSKLVKQCVATFTIYT